jgi:hypothetical protein
MTQNNTDLLSESVVGLDATTTTHFEELKEAGRRKFGAFKAIAASAVLRLALPEYNRGFIHIQR